MKAKAKAKAKATEPVLFFFNASATDEFFEGMDCAAVEITKERAGQLLQMRGAFVRAKAEVRDLLEFFVWDASVHWLDSGKLKGDPEVPDEWVVVTDRHLRRALRDDRLVERTECDQAIVDGGGVRWIAVPRHLDVHVETRLLPWAEIEKIAGVARGIQCEHPGMDCDDPSRCPCECKPCLEAFTAYTQGEI